VAKDRNVGVSGFEFDSMAGWFDEVLLGGATDIVEIEMMDRYSLDTMNGRTLLKASDSSKRRRQMISPIDTQKKWVCVLPSEREYFLSWFLRPFTTLPTQESHPKHT